MRVSPTMEKSLRRRTRLTGKSESAIVREAIEAHLALPPSAESAYDVALRLGLVGAAKNLPADLSGNPIYLEGMGTSR